MQRSVRILLVSVGMLFVFASQLAAQATRTWVSGVGDDVNPCSRTAPCKTFAGAISKTAPGGEINAIDPGGFGFVTITKSIRIDGGATLAGVLASGTNGIVIMAGPTDTVVLRNLDINGAGTAAGTDTRGIKFVSGKQLVIDNCDVSNFAKRGISIESSTDGANVLISNTIVHDQLNNGIVVSPAAGATNHVVIDNVRVVNNAFFGIGINFGSTVQIRNSVFSNNPGGGVLVDNSTADLDSTLVSNNGNGILAQNGATARISNATIVGNSTGLSIGSGAIIYSFGNNQIAGNASGNVGVTGIPRQ